MRIEVIIKTFAISLIVGIFTPQNVSAQTSHSAMIEKGYEEINKGNLEAGIKWIQNAAEMGNAKAQFYLGSFYYVGDGVTKDVDEAAKWYRKAALQDYSLAQFKLGEMYRQGDIESTEYSDSVTEAVYWLNKAALMENDDAQNSLV